MRPDGRWQHGPAQSRRLNRDRQAGPAPDPGPLLPEDSGHIPAARADRRDSFFARTHTAAESNARLYLGLAAQGRSPKVVLLRAYLALLGASQKWYAAGGGKKRPDNPADPYMTLLGYFGSLRELGGSRRIVEDEVGTRLTGYGDRKRDGEAAGDLCRSEGDVRAGRTHQPGEYRQGGRGQAATGPTVRRQRPR